MRWSFYLPSRLYEIYGKFGNLIQFQPQILTDLYVSWPQEI